MQVRLCHLPEGPRRRPYGLHRLLLTEATFSDCDLSDVVFTDCTLRHTEFGTGRYRNTDMRENDLSAIRGVANLAKVRIDRGQKSDLAEALVSELDITIGDV
ncbi:pentapeptide repeat-containing protein [Streptomyces nojiriensis]|uniref:pentapeptide repeat-containing protein n=1 Tax=Streptomyces nojiriensis TaxID=66374 RepID=UPI001673A9FC|nr:pentapeptide repeat-containing protein [Streptomyces nojiriensis]